VKLPRLIPNEWRIVRDAVLFLAGLLGVIHEAFFTDFDRPGLLVLFAAMMGLPAFLRNGYDKPPDKPPPE